MQVRFLPPQLIVSLESDVGSQQRSTGRIHPAPDSRLPSPDTRHFRKSSGRMRSLSRKQVRVRNARCGFESHGFRLEQKHVPLADRQRCQPSKLNRWVRLPQGTFHWNGSSAAEQVFVKHPRVGSSPTRPSSHCGVVSAGRNSWL